MVPRQELMHFPVLLRGRGTYAVRFGRALPAPRQGSAAGKNVDLGTPCDKYTSAAKIDWPGGSPGSETETSGKSGQPENKVSHIGDHEQSPSLTCSTKST